MVILNASVAIYCHLKICVVELLQDLLNDYLSTDDFRNGAVVQSPNITCNVSPSKNFRYFSNINQFGGDWKRP